MEHENLEHLIDDAFQQASQAVARGDFGPATHDPEFGESVPLLQALRDILLEMLGAEHYERNPFALLDKVLAYQIGGTHYKGQAIQHLKYALANDLPYAEGAVMKYLSRNGKKGDEGAQDLDKAIHIILAIRAAHYPEAPASPFVFHGDVPPADRLFNTYGSFERNL